MSTVVFSLSEPCQAPVEKNIGAFSGLIALAQIGFKLDEQDHVPLVYSTGTECVHHLSNPPLAE